MEVRAASEESGESRQTRAALPNGRCASGAVGGDRGPNGWGVSRRLRKGAWRSGAGPPWGLTALGPAFACLFSPPNEEM